MGKMSSNSMKYIQLCFLKFLVIVCLMLSLYVRYEGVFKQRTFVTGLHFDSKFLEQNIVHQYNLRDIFDEYYRYLMIGYIPFAVFNVINACFVWKLPLSLMESLQVLVIVPKVIALVLYRSSVTVDYYHLALDVVPLIALFALARTRTDYETIRWVKTIICISNFRCSNIVHRSCTNCKSRLFKKK